MSDWDNFYNVELPILLVLAILFLPIWLPILLIYNLFQGKEKKINKITSPITITPVSKKPLIYKSLYEKKKYNP